MEGSLSIYIERKTINLEILNKNLVWFMIISVDEPWRKNPWHSSGLTSSSRISDPNWDVTPQFFLNFFVFLFCSRKIVDWRLSRERLWVQDPPLVTTSALRLVLWKGGSCLQEPRSQIPDEQTNQRREFQLINNKQTNQGKENFNWSTMKKPISEENFNWSTINRPISEENFMTFKCIHICMSVSAVKSNTQNLRFLFQFPQLHLFNFYRRKTGKIVKVVEIFNKSLKSAGSLIQWPNWLLTGQQLSKMDSINSTWQIHLQEIRVHYIFTENS